MPDVADLVALLYRADWTRLSLSATIVSRRDHDVERELYRRSADERNQLLGTGPGPRWPPEGPHARTGREEREYPILIAPGGRYRAGTDDGGPVSLSDGRFQWTILSGVARQRPPDGPPRSFHGLITPQWLIASYDLEIVAVTEAGARPAYRVRATPRAVSSGSGPGSYHLLDRVDADVDAELGIILRSEQVFSGQALAVAEMRDLVVDPPQAAGPGLFEPPPGMPREDAPGLGTFEPQGPGWRAAIAAAGAAASAMGFAIRHAPHRPRRAAPGDQEPEMPPGARDLAAALAGLAPAGDDLVNLLHRTGLPAQDIDADLHQWFDLGAYLAAGQAFRSALPQPFAGIFGPDAVWDALGERGRREGSTHRTARLRVSMPGRYRIDYLAGDWGKRFTAIVCDGQSTRKLYANRVATGPVWPLELQFAALVDPAWLLRGWMIRAAGEVSVAGRRGLRIVAEPRAWPARIEFGQLFSPIELVVDTELGILLRQTSYADGRPATRSELRNVTTGTSPADFDLVVAPGLREVTSTGGLLADQDLPAPVKAVGNAAALAAGGAIAGAVAVTGWLQKRRARPDVHDRG